LLPVLGVSVRQSTIPPLHEIGHSAQKALDIVAKDAFSFLVINSVANNVDTISEGAEYGSTTGAIPVDD
jgi:hypothetical protein